MSMFNDVRATNSSYIGTVVSIDDPNSSNRVRVKLDYLTDRIQENHLPWYIVNSSNSNSGNVNVSLPSKGARVVVFLYDSIYNGMVISTLNQNSKVM